MKIKEYRKTIMLSGILAAAIIMAAHFTVMKSARMAVRLYSLKTELNEQGRKTAENKAMNTGHGIHAEVADGSNVIQEILSCIKKHGCSVISVKPEVVINQEKHGLNRISVSYTGNFHDQILVLDSICRTLTPGQAMQECSFMVESGLSGKSVACSFVLNYIIKNHGEKQQI